MIINDKGQTRLVQADAGQDPGRLPRPDLRRQARADVVGGPAVRRRRRRRRPGLRPELQAASRRSRAGNGYSFDLHEFTITPRNTALVLAYERFKRDLRPWGGPRDARIVDNIVQEIDLRPAPCCSSGTASATSRRRSPTSRRRPARGFEWEYFHVNSAEITPDGNFLISARNTSAVYKIDRRTGKIMWRLGGKNSTSSSARACASTGSTAPAAGRRHDQHLRQLGRAAHAQGLARAHVRLDEQAKTATLVSAFKHPRGLLSASQGNVETLPNGNVFVGWGSQRWFTEFDARAARSSSTAGSPAATTTTARSATRGSARRRRRRRSSRRAAAARSRPA